MLKSNVIEREVNTDKYRVTGFMTRYDLDRGSERNLKEFDSYGEAVDLAKSGFYLGHTYYQMSIYKGDTLLSVIRKGVSYCIVPIRYFSDIDDCLKKFKHNTIGREGNYLLEEKNGRVSIYYSRRFSSGDIKDIRNDFDSGEVLDDIYTRGYSKKIVKSATDVIDIVNRVARHPVKRIFIGRRYDWGRYYYHLSKDEEGSVDIYFDWF